MIEVRYQNLSGHFMVRCMLSMIQGRGPALRLPARATARVRPYELRRYMI